MGSYAHVGGKTLEIGNVGMHALLDRVESCVHTQEGQPTTRQGDGINTMKCGPCPGTYRASKDKQSFTLSATLPLPTKCNEGCACTQNGERRDSGMILQLESISCPQPPNTDWAASGVVIHVHQRRTITRKISPSRTRHSNCDPHPASASAQSPLSVTPGDKSACNVIPGFQSEEPLKAATPTNRPNHRVPRKSVWIHSQLLQGHIFRCQSLCPSSLQSATYMHGQPRPAEQHRRESHSHKQHYGISSTETSHSRRRASVVRFDPHPASASALSPTSVTLLTSATITNGIK